MLKYTLSGPQLIYNFPYAQTNTRLSNSRKCKPRMNQASFLLALAPQIQWMTPARDPKQYLLVFILPGFEAWHSGPGTWQLGYFWEVCDRSFGSSYSSGLSKGARGVSGAIIAITHNRFLQVFHYCLKNRKVFEKDIDFVIKMEENTGRQHLCQFFQKHISFWSDIDFVL